MTRKIASIFFSIILLSGLIFTGCPPAPNGEADTLNLYGIDPYTLDPAVSSEMTSHEHIVQIFSGLVCFDENMEPTPDIAESWQISDDGQTYTFYLRQNVRFHNGQKVTADDVKYSWERACHPATGSQTAATYLGDIGGTDKVLAGESEEISGLKVIDDYTLEVTLDNPKSYFLSKLTYPTTFVVDRDNVSSGQTWWQQPNGTGPFKLKQWNENILLRLEKNELYYGEIARVDYVDFHLWGGVPMNMYENGDIDVTSVSMSYIDKVTDETGSFYQELVIEPELSLYYIGFNTNKPPFDDVNIRLAFSYAIDKDKLASLVFKDMVEPANGILPPGMPGYNENLHSIEYDVAKAQELISNSKYGDVSELPPITITTIGWGGVISPELEAIIYDWRQNLGVEVKVRQLEPEVFLYNLKQEKDEMYYMGWVADYPHPQDFLDILFYSNAENNYGEYSNPEVDVLLEQANIEQDGELSMALYQQAEQILVEEAACLPLWFGKNYTLIKPYVKGYELNPLGFAKLNMVTIERQ